MSKSPFLQPRKKRTAAEEDEKKTKKVPKDFINEVMDFARLHRDEVFRSEESVPTKLRELKTVPGSILESDYMVPRLLSGSDLSGDTTHVANYKAFEKRFGTEAGVFKVSGGYKAFGIAVLLSAFTPDILEALNGLKDYPSLDDQVLSEVEKESIEDAWLDWARFDFVHELQDLLPQQEELIDELTDEQVMELFTTVRKRIGADWVFETGGKAYIDVGKIASEVAVDDLPQALDIEAAEEPKTAAVQKGKVFYPDNPKRMEAIAARLNQMGLSAEAIHTGGNIWCVDVQTKTGSLLWGVAGEKWGATAQDKNWEYTGEDVLTHVDAESDDLEQVVKAIYDESVKHGARPSQKQRS